MVVRYKCRTEATQGQPGSQQLNKRHQIGLLSCAQMVSGFQWRS